MENGQVEILEFDGKDFKVVMQYEGWKVGLLRYSERFSSVKQMERHLLTDEVFVLLDGQATLYTMDQNNTIKKHDMDKKKVYQVKKNTWHHITVSHDATVLVIENSNTSKMNTEKVSL